MSDAAIVSPSSAAQLADGKGVVPSCADTVKASHRN
jgi:hypothetical protein